jgi:MYXO-CTERM domain-containing protein
MTKLMTWLRAGSIAFLLLLGAVAMQPATAQDAATEVATTAAETVDTAANTVDDDDDGFDWGLLGLIGLLGLGGLFRRPRPVVHDTDRTGFTGASDRIDNRGL